MVTEAHSVALTPMLQVALRGNVELRKEVLGTAGKRGRPGLKEPVYDALNKVPAAASAALVYLGGRLLWLVGVAMQSPHAAPACSPSLPPTHSS